MSENRKTHLERARAAVVRVIGEAASDEERDIVAQETYPADLVEAAKGLLLRNRRGWRMVGQDWDELHDALALYEEAPE